MYQIGSRLLGLNGDRSDYDYMDDDLERQDTFRDIVNDHFERGKHCYHYSREYLDRAARFEIDDTEDFQFVYNAEDFLAGAISINPLDYRDEWIRRLKALDLKTPYWWNPRRQGYMKQFYHIVYNLEALKSNSLEVTAEIKEKLKRFHDRVATQEEYDAVIKEIEEL